MPSRLENLIRKLQWNNFVHKKMTPPGAGQTAVAAHTETTIKPYTWMAEPIPKTKPTVYRLQDTISIVINFSATASWVADWVFKQPQQFQDELLVHEQGHYNITALLARDLFIDLMQLKSQVYKTTQAATSDVNTIQKRYSNALIKAINDKYDSITETNHGANKPAQQRWNGYFNQAFTQPRNPPMQAPDGTPYKATLLDVLKTAGVYP